MGQLRIELLKDLSELEDFRCGVSAMDKFIANGLNQSVQNNYCTLYSVREEDKLVAFFALSCDSLMLDTDDKEDLSAGFTTASTPQVSSDYSDVFWAKMRYPAIEIAYLAVSEDQRGKSIGSVIVQEIADLASRQTLLGCQFITVEAYCTADYSAVGFYSKCGFSPTEMKKAYKDTVRMFYTLYPMSVEE